MRTCLHWLGLGVIIFSATACSRNEPATAAATSAAASAAATSAPGEAPIPGGEDPGAAGAARPAAPMAESEHVTVAWNCDGKPVTADYDNAKGQLRLQIGAELLTLPQAASGSGARYADPAGNEFWEHQGQATLALAGGKALPCHKEARGG